MKCVQMFPVTWPKWYPFSYYGKNLQKSPSSEPRGRWLWNMVYIIVYSSTTTLVQMMTLVDLDHGQICFLVLLRGWKLTQHTVIYFQACSNIQHVLCTQVSDAGPMVLWFVHITLRGFLNILMACYNMRTFVNLTCTKVKEHLISFVSAYQLYVLNASSDVSSTASTILLCSWR